MHESSARSKADAQITKRVDKTPGITEGKMGKENDEGMLTKDEGRFLLSLARRAIEHYLEKGDFIEIKPSDIPSSGRLIQDGACFVTIYKGKGQDLRGCIGTLEASRPLVFDVADNAYNSAFRDPRFPPLRKVELKDIKIEISVLTQPKKMEVDSSDELISKLIPRKHGLILQKGYARATFLPVVWDELRGKEEFLSHLCMKAGLRPDEWKDVSGMEFYTYQAQEFEEGGE